MGEGGSPWWAQAFARGGDSRDLTPGRATCLAENVSMCACELVCVCMYISVLATKPPWAGKLGEEEGPGGLGAWGEGLRSRGPFLRRETHVPMEARGWGMGHGTTSHLNTALFSL